MGRCQGFSDSLELSWTNRRLGWKRWPVELESGSGALGRNQQDLTGRGDQPSGKVVKEDLAVLEFSSWTKRVSLKSTLHYRR